MSYGYLKENTASLWMSPDNTLARWPTTGQGGVTATAASSLTVSASASNPVILEAVEFEKCSADAQNVTIYAHNGTTPLWVFNPANSAATQWFPVGGPYGTQLNQGFSASRTASAGNVKIYFRY
jgi:hypothetical protein